MERDMTLVDLTHTLASLGTLTLLEIILGIDNIVFIAILSSKLPQHQQKRAQQLGLGFAWLTRLILLSVALQISTLSQVLFTIGEWACSGRDLFLLIGGSFLIIKATHEIHDEISPIESDTHYSQHATLLKTVVQIGLLDIVFSLDSILTAVGLTPHFWIMATAISITVITMIVAAERLCAFIETHPTIKMLALSFLMVIGTVLIADACHVVIPRGYIYIAVTYALIVESLNIIRHKKRSGL